MEQKLKSLVFVVLFIALLTNHVQAKPTFKLEFIGEHTFPTGHKFKNKELGGLSGIDYNKSSSTFVVISDDHAQKGSARFYDMTINLDDGFLNMDDIKITKMTEILDVDGKSFGSGEVDPESIRISNSTDLLYWTSEGNAKKGQAPFVRAMTLDGEHVSNLKIPKKYSPASNAGIRNNRAFESLTFSNSQTNVITATENALIQDGASPNHKEGSQVRILELNRKTGKAESEHIYKTDPVAKPSILGGRFNTSGLVDLLVVDESYMIAVERSFSLGTGFTIKLYLTSYTGTENVLHLDSIRDADHQVKPMEKHLLLNLDDLGIGLDNIEGITFGPRLSDGSRSIILVSDNNFKKGQKTQFLAFKLNHTDSNELGLEPLVLPHNQWQQIALPMSPPAGSNTVATVFGDDIEGEYGEDWVLYAHDAMSDSYIDPGLEGIVSLGKGYWIIQLSEEDVTIDLPEGSAQASLTKQSQCTSSEGCYKVDLTAQENMQQRVMLGNPFPKKAIWSDLRVTTSSGDCSKVDGCTLNEAESSGVFLRKAWRYNPATKNYDIIENSTQLNSWDGFWSLTLSDASDLNPKLLIPMK